MNIAWLIFAKMRIVVALTRNTVFPLTILHAKSNETQSNCCGARWVCRMQSDVSPSIGCWEMATVK